MEKKNGLTETEKKEVEEYSILQIIWKSDDMSARSVDLELKAKMFRGFADPTRLSILESLRKWERTVSAIAESTRQSQSNVSNHLSCLKECGPLASRRDGKSIYYSTTSERVRCLLEDGDEVVAEVGERMSRCTRYNRSGDEQEER